MAGRFPGADSTAGLRELLREGKDAIREVPPERWDADELYDPHNEPGKMHTRWMGSLDGIDLFDPQFFGISRREASRMDPQQRILLEASWEALESAGIAPASLSGTPTGVFVGIWGVEYTLDFWNREPNPIARRKRLDGWVGAGNAHCIAANRISFLLDLKGPSIAVDTACSSSLVALHLACQSVWTGESDLALAAGVNILIPPDTTIAASQAQMLSADGRCKSFDAGADGYVRSEGCGVILLKRLSDAVHDGDHVHALIRGTATNQDGRTSALTVPSAEAQESVMRRALATAGVDPSQLTYFEAHGTGTPIGDPTEVRAIANVVGSKRSPDHRCLLGSLKANIGHLETASGIASVIKVILGLEHEEIYPQINLEQLNPKISLQGTPLEIPTELEPWRRGTTPRVAGVNSFGFGGANAHVLLEEAPAPTPRRQVPERPSHVLALSARTEEPLKELAGRFRDACAGASREELPDICFTAGAGRNHFEHRVAVTGGSPEELSSKLDAFAGGARGAFHEGEARPGSKPRLAFLFPGQGAQYAGMALGLYDREPVFRRSLDACAEILDDLLERRLLSLLDPTARQESLLDETRYTQPALFAVEYALAELWASWGVNAEFACGHSVGEYVAACVAGVFSLEDALGLIARRAELMGGLPPGGAMAAVLAEQDLVAEVVAPYGGAVAIAAVNAPASVTISGASEPVGDALRQLESRGIAVRPLPVSHAFHSPLMDPILAELERAAAKIEHSEPALRLASNLAGKLFEPGERPDAGYWRAHARNPVRFAGCAAAIAEAGANVFVEVGPNPTLIGLGKRCVPDDGLVWLPSLKMGAGDHAVLAESLAALYARGVQVDWARRDLSRPRRRLRLPTYPFQRTRYWNDNHEDEGPGAASAAPVAEQGTHPLLGERLAMADPAFQSRLSVKRFPYLAGHAVQGSVVLPAACYLELAVAAGAAADGGVTGTLSEVEFKRPLSLTEDGARTLQVVLAPEELGEREFRVHSSAADGKWTLHAVGRTAQPAGDGAKPPSLQIDAFRSRADEEIPADALYAALREFGLEYGTAFRAVTSVWRSHGEALGRLDLPENLGDTEAYHLHPALLDACLHVVAPALGSSQEAADAAPGPVVPVGVDRFAIHGEPTMPLWVHARLRHEVTAADVSIEADILVYDDAGDPVAEIGGLQLQRLDVRGTGKEVEDPRRWLYAVEWEEATQAESDAKEQPEEPGTWVVVGDRSQGAAALGSRMRDRGGDCVELYTSDGEISSALTEALEDGAGPRAVMAFFADGSDEEGTAHEAHLPAETLSSVTRLLELTQALGARPHAAPQLVLVTRGAHTLTGHGASRVAPDQAALWGFLMSVLHEQPHLRCRGVDLDPARPAGEADQLARELHAAGDETHVALRGGRRYVARLRRYVAQPRRHELAGGQGASESTALRVPHAAPQVEPGPDEVGIAVRAAGQSGHECAGTVVAVGERAEGVSVGDEVIAVVERGLATHVTARADFVVPKPAGLGFEEAATVPIAFLTARYALRHVARLQAGESCLIHAPAGGSGQAAIQVARAEGATIYASADSDQGLAQLRSQGVQRVMDSRRPDFARKVLRATDGEGVDVVLGSLGETVPASLSVLKPFGRFLELGRRDIGHLIRSRPEVVARLLREIPEQLERGGPGPLPRGQGSPSASLDDHATYMITGGLGSLGLAVARWMIDQGARHLVLVSRRPPSESAARDLEELRESGAEVLTVAADVSNPQDVRRALELPGAMPPLRGLVHAAGVLDDGLATELDRERVARVMAPKVAGAWNLHLATAAHKLDFFVLFSSVIGVLGAPAQANYAAANAFLDALAHRRRSQGLPALSIDWSGWAEIGMAAEASRNGRSIISEVGTLSPEQGVETLGRLLEADEPQVAVLPFRWGRWRELFPSFSRSPLLRELVEAEVDEHDAAQTADLEAARRILAAGADERLGLIASFLQQELARVLEIESDTLDVDAPLTHIGLDSLMALEVKNRVETTHGIELPIVGLIEDPTITNLATQVSELLTGRGADAAARPGGEAEEAAAATAEILENLDELSDQEVDALLGSTRGGTDPG